MNHPLALLSKKRVGLCLVFFLMLCALTASMPEQSFYAGTAEMTDIRVGLAGLYKEKSVLTIENKRIGLGYCIQDSYICNEEFESETGFAFTPATGCYYVLNQTFSTYKKAESVAAVIRTLGVDAYPTAVYRNYWRVYVGGWISADEAQEAYAVLKGRFGYTYSALQENNQHRVIVQAADYCFLIEGKTKSAYPQFKALDADKSGNYVLSLGDRSYRGRIEIGCYGKVSVTAVNIINIEAYLYGVVPSEMISTSPQEALKAQAVCARSFALMRVGYRADSNISRAYYLDDTTSCQVYRGYGAETTKTTVAVKATSGEVLTYQGEMVAAYYFSTSGGSTEDAAEVWGWETPYLQAVPDLYETEPEKAPWLIKYTRTELEKKLAAYGLKTGELQSVSPSITTMTGRVYLLKLRGADKSVVLQAGTIREVLGLPSTKFQVVTQGDVPDKVAVRGADTAANVRISDCYAISAGGTVTKMSEDMTGYQVISADNLTGFLKDAPSEAGVWYFYGSGYGHGVGMSQSGACGMAKAGYSYKEIIEYYYTGCKVRLRSELAN